MGFVFFGGKASLLNEQTENKTSPMLIGRGYLGNAVRFCDHERRYRELIQVGQQVETRLTNLVRYGYTRKKSNS